MGSQGAHQLHPGRVDLTLVLVHLLGGVQERHGREHPLARLAVAGRDRCGFGRAGLDRLGFGVERDVDVVGVGRWLVGRCVLGEDRSRGRRGGLGLVVVQVLDGRHEGLAPPEPEGRAARGGAGAAQAPAHRLQGDAGGDQDADEDHGHEEDGGAGGAEPGVQGRADHPAQVAAPLAQGGGVGQGRGALGQLGQATHAEQAEHDADGQADRIGAGRRVLPPLAPVDQQRHAGADDDERQEDAGPAGDEGQGGVGAVADRAELLAPQGQGEQDAEGDQAHGPQVACLDAPERRARLGGGLGTVGGLLAGRAGGRTRRGPPAGLGHHSEAETTG